MDENKIIDALGGTNEVARLCEVTKAAVSQWRRGGIPRARLLYLKAIRPEAFEEVSPAGTAGLEREAA
ncbi:MAG: hypothetical protein B6D47_12975 [Rhodocyclaceae bacterium UTPRO2]|jgi:predicted transcriptional regulator|nr:MAG: hypothetical protein B6D47_12975 [Rhodocyclaceae bacterium UTPRO2]